MNSNRFTPFPILYTKRLTLRQLKPDDKSLVFQLRRDEAVGRFIDRVKPTQEQQAVEFINQIAKGVEAGRSMYWVISLNTDPALLGTICLWNFSDDGKTGEMGYELFPAFQGQGLVSEAVASVLDFAFTYCKLKKLEAYTHRENLRSVRLLRKFGFLQVPGKTDPDNADVEGYELQKPN